MKIYSGLRNGAKATVYVDGVPLSLDRSLAIRNHAPDIEWGYRGSGPTQLALALLIDCFNDTEKAYNLYIDFRDDWVSTFPFDGWVALDSDILEWSDTKFQKGDE